MKERTYKKRLDFQSQMISRQSRQIDALKLENEKLKEKIKEKDNIISSIEPMRKEMADSIKEYKRLKNEYKTNVQELKQMKDIMNKEVFKNRWWLLKLILK